MLPCHATQHKFYSKQKRVLEKLKEIEINSYIVSFNNTFTNPHPNQPYMPEDLLHSLLGLAVADEYMFWNTKKDLSLSIQLYAGWLQCWLCLA